MSLMTHTLPLGARDVAAPRRETLGSAHLAMIRRFVKFALMVTGFFALMVAVMSVKYAAFFLHIPR
jgi:hypothetical protein